MADKEWISDTLPLGRQTDYVAVYTPSLLYPIPRTQCRDELGLDAESLPFRGVDIWTGYEISWLGSRGKPVVVVGEFSVPCTSPNIIESKSFKLYLNSLNQTRFASTKEVVSTLERDLSAAAGAPVMVALKTLGAVAGEGVGHFTGENIDARDIDIDTYVPAAGLLQLLDGGEVVSENLYSDLLKSNCPVTGQPDWASVYISYRGAAIDKDSLLRYIIAFRQHQDFHEHCVERMFTEIKAQCQPEKLTVYARYTRRGGLDINPFRSDCGDSPLHVRLVRQ